MTSPLPLFLLSPILAQAQVVECPTFYPWEDTVLTEVPVGRAGIGSVSRSPLMGATIWEREPRRKGAELIGETIKVNGGFDTRYRVGPDQQKWLACWYGKDGAVQWWEKLAKSATSCVVEVRTSGGRRDYPNDPVSVKVKCS